MCISMEFAVQIYEPGKLFLISNFDSSGGRGMRQTHMNIGDLTGRYSVGNIDKTDSMSLFTLFLNQDKTLFTNLHLKV